MRFFFVVFVIVVVVTMLGEKENKNRRGTIEFSCLNCRILYLSPAQLAHYCHRNVQLNVELVQTKDSGCTV